MKPLGLVAAAATIAFIYAIAHSLGLREDASILSGTVPPGANGAAAGLVYIALYFAFVVLTPILVIAAGIMKLLSNQTRWPRR